LQVVPDSRLVWSAAHLGHFAIPAAELDGRVALETVVVCNVDELGFVIVREGDDTHGLLGLIRCVGDAFAVAAATGLPRRKLGFAE
jgi:hypothetical protein